MAWGTIYTNVLSTLAGTVAVFELCGEHCDGPNIRTVFLAVTVAVIANLAGLLQAPRAHSRV